MPVLRYFIFVGIGLVALLFLTAAYLPNPVGRADVTRPGNIRITAVRIGPEAVTFSGNSVNFGPAPEMRIVDSAAAAAPATEAFAQLTVSRAFPIEVASAPKPKKIAKRRARPQPPAPEFDAFAAQPARGWPGPRLAGTLFGW